MVVSQFTLYGNLRKWNRPSFNRSASPESAVPLYETFVKTLSEIMGKPVATDRKSLLRAPTACFAPTVWSRWVG